MYNNALFHLIFYIQTNLRLISHVICLPKEYLEDDDDDDDGEKLQVEQEGEGGEEWHSPWRLDICPSLGTLLGSLSSQQGCIKFPTIFQLLIFFSKIFVLFPSSPLDIQQPLKLYFSCPVLLSTCYPTFYQIKSYK